MPFPSRRKRMLILAATAAVAGFGATDAMASGAVYTQTNDPAGNVVQAFDRAADGSLGAARSHPTGGAGLAGLGGRQGAVHRQRLRLDQRLPRRHRRRSDRARRRRAHRRPRPLAARPRRVAQRPLPVRRQPGQRRGRRGPRDAFKVAVDGSLREVDSVPAAIGITGAAAA